MRFWALIKQGQDLMRLWPQDPRVTAAFEEARMSSMIKVFGRVFPPACALILFWVYYICGGLEGLYLLYTRPGAGSLYLYLAITGLVFVLIVLLTLPLHGLLWLGNRAERPLTARQAAFYRELMSKLQRQEAPNPVFLDLIRALHDACATLKDRDFLDLL